MYNLYRSQRFLKAIFHSALCFAMIFSVSIAKAHEIAPFLTKTDQSIAARAENGLISPSAYALWQEAFSQGTVLRHNQKDKDARTAFVEIQAELEQQMIRAIAQKDTKALWIIHTPLIATPVVTEGLISEGLVSTSILQETDRTRVSTSLERSKLMRLFLNRGGFLIVAYAASQREGEKGRTPSQIAIFEKLKKQYPKQLIEFPIASSHFSEGNYPLDKIGATYFLREPHGKFEMTNRGLQINDARDNATWGLWINHPDFDISSRLNEVMLFLEQAGLREQISLHCQEHHISPKEILSFFS